MSTQPHVVIVGGGFGGLSAARALRKAPRLASMRKTQANKKPLVVVVDDDTSMRETTQDLLESAGMRAAMFASAEAVTFPSGTAVSNADKAVDVSIRGSIIES